RSGGRTIREGRNETAYRAIAEASLQHARERSEIARLLLAISGIVATPNASRSRWVRVEEIGANPLSGQARVRRADQDFIDEDRIIVGVRNRRGKSRDRARRGIIRDRIQRGIGSRVRWTGQGGERR